MGTRLEVSQRALRRLLLYCAPYLTEFDDAFRLKQRLTQASGERVLDGAEAHREEISVALKGVL